jgi:hypothetical protein
MQEQANVSLSAVELELVSNPQWILTKNGIIQKVLQLLGSVSSTLQQHPMLKTLPVELTTVPPKLSKGENYLGLPYVMLDFPRQFSSEDVFAIRSFFWWGHYFTCTLHLKGKWKDFYQVPLLQSYRAGKLVHALMNRTQEEWEHELSELHWQPVTEAALLHNETGVLLKLAFTCDLKNWEESPLFFQQSVTTFLGALQD